MLDWVCELVSFSFPLFSEDPGCWLILQPLGSQGEVLSATILEEMAPSGAGFSGRKGVRTGTSQPGRGTKQPQQFRC